MENNRWLVIGAVIAGIVLLGLGLMYFVEPAKSLPSFIPGHEAGSATITSSTASPPWCSASAASCSPGSSRARSRWPAS